MVLKKIRDIVRWVVVLFFRTTSLAVVVYRCIPVYVAPLMLVRCVQQVADGESVGLDHVAQVLKNNADCEVAIQGYTDATGNDGYNLPLSQNRANAVSTYLKSCGVSNSQIKSVEGLGSANPVVNTTAACAQNRRVEVYMYASQAMVNAANNGTLK